MSFSTWRRFIRPIWKRIKNIIQKRSFYHNSTANLALNRTYFGYNYLMWSILLIVQHVSPRPIKIDWLTCNSFDSSNRKERWNSTRALCSSFCRKRTINQRSVTITKCRMYLSKFEFEIAFGAGQNKTAIIYYLLRLTLTPSIFIVENYDILRLRGRQADLCPHLQWTSRVNSVKKGCTQYLQMYDFPLPGAKKLNSVTWIILAEVFRTMKMFALGTEEWASFPTQRDFHI